MKRMTMREAIIATLEEEMQRDAHVFIMGEDVGRYGGGFGATQGLQERFGESRVMDMPISEGAFMNMAVGAAMAGERPVVEFMFSDFVSEAMDGIVNQAAKMRFMTGGQASVPLVIRGACGGGMGAAAQHSQSLEAWFCHVPGLKVVMPAAAGDAAGLLRTAIRDDGPVVFLEHKLCYDLEGDVDGRAIPLGKAEVKRRGRDVTIVTYSYGVIKAMAAAARLAREGIDAEVVDLMTLSPLDMETVERSADKTGRVIVVHDAVEQCGVGAEVSARLAEGPVFYRLKRPVVRIGGAFLPMPFAKELERQAVPQAEEIEEAARRLVDGTTKRFFRLAGR